jgi:TonB family protein
MAGPLRTARGPSCGSARGGIVRCDDCQTEPLTPGHYCECCGRKLSLKEREELGLDGALPTPTRVGAADIVRCDLCGAPCTDGDLCPACHQAFQSLLEPPTVTQPAEPVVELAPIVDFALPPPVHPAIEVAAPAPAPAPALGTAAAAAPEPTVTVMPEPEPPWVPEVKAEPAAGQKVKAIPQTAAVAAPKQVNGKSRSIGLTGAVIVIVSAIGFPLGTYWLGRQQEITVVSDGQPADARPQAPAAIDRPVPSSAVVPPETPAPAKRAVVDTPIKVNASTAAPPTAIKPSPGKPTPTKPSPGTPTPTKPSSGTPTPTKPSPGTPTPTKPSPETPTPTKPSPETPTPTNIRPNTASRLPAPVVAPVQAPPPAEVLPPAAEPVMPEPPAPEPPKPAAGPFFEQRQVDQAPGIASRVEPNVPDSPRPINDLVVVRVLVSQSGHPSAVSVLRPSKSGSALDDAVVAAVKQWTFSPARKRGEAVSCWYNFGVPIRRSE